MRRLKMTTAQVAEISVTVHSSPVQDYTLTRTIIFHLHLLINFTVYTHTYTLLFSSFYFGFVNMSLLLIRVKPLLASTNFVALTVALTNCMNNLAARILSYSAPEEREGAE